MRKRNKMVRAVCGLALLGTLWLPTALTADAKEPELPGYHEYQVTEEESIDHWYGISRGAYLSEGICGIKRAGTAKVSVSGTTNAHSVCDKVKVGVYLDESSNGGSSFGTIGSYYFEEENTIFCHGSKTDISVTSGRLYRARGGHSVIEGSVVETTTTCSSAITAS